MLGAVFDTRTPPGLIRTRRLAYPAAVLVRDRDVLQPQLRRRKTRVHGFQGVGDGAGDLRRTSTLLSVSRMSGIASTGGFDLARVALGAIPSARGTGSIFEPLGYKPLAGVYVYLPQRPGAGVHELVRHAGRHHHDLPPPRLDDLIPGRERGALPCCTTKTSS